MNFMKRNWDAILAFLFIWIIPLIFLLATGIEFYTKNDSKVEIKIEFCTIFILAILLILYFKKFKKTIERKLLIVEIKNTRNRPAYVLINGIVTIITIFLGYLIIKVLMMFCAAIDKFLLVCIASVSIGEIFNFIHALKVVSLEE